MHEQQAADACRGTVVHTDPLDGNELEAMRLKTTHNHVNRVSLPGDPDYPPSGGICGHCQEPTPSINMTCCPACSMAGKGRVTEDRKKELEIGKYAKAPGGWFV